MLLLHVKHSGKDLPGRCAQSLEEVGETKGDRRAVSGWGILRSSERGGPSYLYRYTPPCRHRLPTVSSGFAHDEVRKDRARGDRRLPIREGSPGMEVTVHGEGPGGRPEGEGEDLPAARASGRGRSLEGEPGNSGRDGRGPLPRCSRAATLDPGRGIVGDHPNSKASQQASSGDSSVSSWAKKRAPGEVAGDINRIVDSTKEFQIMSSGQAWDQERLYRELSLEEFA